MLAYAFALPDIARRRPFDWADGLVSGAAYAAFDFLGGQHRLDGTIYPAIASVPGWSFSRASTGYARTQAGVVQSFASGAPRITDKGFLIEGARTNLLLRRQEFDNASWTKTEATVSANAVSAPDGTATMDKLVESANSAVHFIAQAATISSGATVTVSAYFKAAERTRGELRIGVTGGNANTFFDLSAGTVFTTTSTGAVSGHVATIEALAGGIYRVSLTGVTAGVTSASLLVILVQSGTTDNYTGDNASGLYIWGAQLEAAAGASSYIPTTSGTVTRAADSAVIAASPATPLSLFAEFERPYDTGAVETIFGVDDNTSNERCILGIGSTDLATLTMTAGGVATANFTVATAMALGVLHKMAAAFALNDVRGYRGGAAGTPDTSAAVPASMTRIRFSLGLFKRAAIYPRALTDAELQAITA